MGVEFNIQRGSALPFKRKQESGLRNVYIERFAMKDIWNGNGTIQKSYQFDGSTGIIQ